MEIESCLLDEESICYELASRFYGEFIELASHEGIPAKHHQLLIEKLEEIERGDIDRLMIFMPPGSAKSTYASKFFPPWYLGKNPSKNIVLASYGQRLAARFGKKCRDIASSDLFKKVFGYSLAADSKAKDEWEITKVEGTKAFSQDISLGGEFTATSVDGSVTGRRADLIVIDDPIKGRKNADSEVYRDATWEWYLSDLLTRLKPGGAVVLIQTRWHEDDLAGRILPEDYEGDSGKITAKDGEEWEVISIRAEAEAKDPLGREPGEFLWADWFGGSFFPQKKKTMGERNWNALYQQNPTPGEGNFFKREHIKYYDAPPRHLRIYGASDYAVSDGEGDYTVHGVAGTDTDKKLYILDWWRDQKDSSVWVEEFINLAKKWKPLEWGEEQGQILKSLNPFIRQRMEDEKCYFYRKQFTSAVDKQTRAQAIRGLFAMGKIYLPRNAPWAAKLVAELLAFPAGTYDDQVDVLSLFGRMLMDMDKAKEPKPTKKKEGIIGNDLLAMAKRMGRD